MDSDGFEAGLAPAIEPGADDVPRETRPPPPSPPEPPKRALKAPVAAGERVASVDVLRGFALFGILVMNIVAFALPWPAYWNPLLGGGSGVLDTATWWVTHVVFEMKFMTLFSMLFGAGLALMAQRAEERGGRFGGVYYRRCFWLVVLGAIHGYLLWIGDILFWYGICGMILYPLRRVRPTILIPLGLGLTLVVVLTGSLFTLVKLPHMERAADEARAARAAGETVTEEQSEAIETWKRFEAGTKPEDLEEEIAVYKEGRWADQVVFRAPQVFGSQVGLVFFGFWRVAGVMLVGMGLLKLGVLSAARSTAFYRRCCLFGYGLGLPVVIAGAVASWSRGFAPSYAKVWGAFPNYFGSLAVALGHLGLVMLVWKAGVLRGLLLRVGAVGRMALTNYLSHTLIATFIFYGGWGLGFFNDFGRFALMGFVLAIYVFQLVASPLWLRRFRFGPAEWLWRSLTYARRQPMRIPEAPAA